MCVFMCVFMCVCVCAKKKCIEVCNYECKYERRYGSECMHACMHEKNEMGEDTTIISVKRKGKEEKTIRSGEKRLQPQNKGKEKKFFRTIFILFALKVPANITNRKERSTFQTLAIEIFLPQSGVSSDLFEKEIDEEMGNRE